MYLKNEEEKREERGEEGEEKEGRNKGKKGRRSVGRDPRWGRGEKGRKMGVD